MTKIGLIHATLNAVQPMVDAFRRHEPSVTVLNFLDEGLLAAVNESGGVTPAILRRFVRLLSTAADSGVDGILLSCSVFSPSVPVISPLFAVPVVSVDAAMLETAVDMGRRIGVVATVGASGPTTAGQLAEIAGARKQQIHVEVMVSAEAFCRLQAGDANGHDELVRQKVAELSPRVDVVVLAQISMARAAKKMQDIPVPVLTSPESSIKAIMSRLKKGATI